MARCTSFRGNTVSNPNPNYREIERRFLVDQIPADVLESPSSNVEQGYLSGYPLTVRIRRISEGESFLTIKRGDPANREEREIALDDAQFETLWPMTEGWRIEKTRHRHPFGECLIELDIFSGRHHGLVIAEVEFPSTEAAAAFVAPGWFGAEVTHNPAYSNASLAAPESGEK